MNTFLKALGIRFIFLIISSIIIILDYYFGGNYIEFFLKEQLILTMITILGFSTASISFLVSHILEIENNNEFSNSKTEIFHNFIAMLIILFISFTVLSGYNFPISGLTKDLGNGILLTFMFSFLLCFGFLFYEIIYAIIFISKNK